MKQNRIMKRIFIAACLLLVCSCGVYQNAPIPQKAKYVIMDHICDSMNIAIGQRAPFFNKSYRWADKVEMEKDMIQYYQTVRPRSQPPTFNMVPASSFYYLKDERAFCSGGQRPIKLSKHEVFMLHYSYSFSDDLFRMEFSPSPILDRKTGDTLRVVQRSEMKDIIYVIKRCNPFDIQYSFRFNYRGACYFITCHDIKKNTQKVSGKEYFKRYDKSKYRVIKEPIIGSIHYTS